jgi:bacterial/archaeal transporter family-2 protein
MPQKREFALPFLFYIGAVCAGISLAVQQVLNSNLRMQIGSPWWAGATSYLVGTVAMLTVAISVDGVRSLGPMIARVQGFTWIGGLLGSIFIGTVILVVPRLGAATTLALVVVGQLSTAVIMDHFGFLGITQHLLSPSRVAGVLLLIGGVVLVRW